MTEKPYAPGFDLRDGTRPVSNGFVRPQRSLMSPAQFVASGFGPESLLQEDCVKWFRDAYPQLKRLLYSSLNGAELREGGKEWRRLEREGAVSGVADLFLAVPSGELAGLYIEIKTRTGEQRPEQVAFEEAVVTQGYGYVMPRSKKQFIRFVTAYLEHGTYR